MAPGIGPRLACALVDRFGSPDGVLAATPKELIQVSRMTEAKARALKDPEILTRAEAELTFIADHNVQTYFLTDDNYPQRLRDCHDAPIMLFGKGNTSLEAEKTVAIIGTRKNTDYGLKLTEELVDGLKEVPGILVISGLAYGIDAIAHKKAVKSGVPTLGVLAHGLDNIYPPMHKNLSLEMLGNGGLLTEFTSGTNPDRSNFPIRNRIVAGLSDVTVVVESDIKGGAIITAMLAASYHREVMAFPGRITDTRSAGCNDLLQKNMASMITRAGDLLSLMRWAANTGVSAKPQLLFPDLQPEEQKIIDILQGKESVHSDELFHLTGFPASSLASTLLQLEMLGAVKTLPGKRYKLA
ncbi:DNA-processing protein DprA [Taibaiella soli]|nr:DNA-processing protein DprA [Taibaiella soli]